MLLQFDCQRIPQVALEAASTPQPKPCLWYRAIDVLPVWNLKMAPHRSYAEVLLTPLNRMWLGPMYGIGAKLKYQTCYTGKRQYNLANSEVLTPLGCQMTSANQSISHFLTFMHHPKYFRLGNGKRASPLLTSALSLSSWQVQVTELEIHA